MLGAVVGKGEVVAKGAAMVGVRRAEESETFSKTITPNHTVLPEVLEKWPQIIMRKLLPRHMKIIDNRGNKTFFTSPFHIVFALWDLVYFLVVFLGPTRKNRLQFVIMCYHA
jgi:hypothetical protein